MAEKVGEIYYTVTLETQDLLNKARQVDKQITGLATRFSEVGAAVKALFLGMSVLTVIDTADQWGQYASRIKMATKSTEEYNLVQARMLASANKTYRSINETREGFIRMSPALRDMGLSLNESIDAVDAFSGLLVVNAASADRGASALAAYSKSLQKGKLDSDAWESISTTMPSVIDLIAKSSGKAAEEVRKMGAEGKLSVQDFTRAMVSNLGEINKQVEGMPTTVQDALKKVGNGFAEYIGWSNQAHGITATLSSTIGILGDNFAFLANVGLAAATGAILRSTAAMAVSAVASIQAARQATITAATELAAARAEAAHTTAVLAKVTALQALTPVQAQATAATIAHEAALKRVAVAEAASVAASSMGARAAAAAVGLMSGPAGMAIAAAAVAAGFLSMRDSTGAASQSLIDMSKPAQDVVASFRELNALQREQQLAVIGKQVADSLTDANAALYTFVSTFKVSMAHGGKAAAQFRSDFATEAKGLAADVTLSSDELASAMSELVARWAQGMGWSKEYTQEMVRNAGAVVEASGKHRTLSSTLQEVGLAAQGSAAAIRDNNRALGGVGDAAQTQLDALDRQIALYGKAGSAAGIYYDLLQAQQGKGVYKGHNDVELAAIKKKADALAVAEKSGRKVPTGSTTKSDATGYLAGLSAAVASEWDKVAIVETEALRDAAARHKQGSLTATQYEQAKAAILLKGSKDREEINTRALSSLQDQAAQVDKMTTSERLAYDIKKGAVTLQGEALEQAKALAQKIDATKKAEEARKVTLNQENAILSAQRDLYLQIEGYRVAQAGRTMGDKAGQDMANRLQIVQNYTNRIRDLEDQQRSDIAANPDKEAATRAQYEAQIAIQRQYQELSLAEYDKAVQRRLAAEGDWTDGAQKALANYLESARDISAQTNQLWTKGFQGMEDALVSFATTGKADFKSLANSIIADLIRIQIRQAMSGAMGGKSGGGILGLIGSIAGLFGGVAAGGGGGGVDYSLGGGGSGGLGLKLPGKSSGGYTGDGGKYEPKGIVHGGEYVINKESTSKLGLAYLDRLNGYSSGGYVGAVPSPSGSANGQGGLSVVFNPTYQIDGTADKAAAMVQMQRISADSQKQLVEQLKRVRVIPQ